jgi:hypothetical protein
MTTKNFKLSAHEIKPLVNAMGSCIATDHITVEGYPVRFMYREAPDNEYDSGWRFFSGFEDEASMDDPNFHGVYDVNTIANYDPSLIPFLSAAPGAAFEKAEASEQFVQVTDWAPGGD